MTVETENGIMTLAEYASDRGNYDEDGGLGCPYCPTVLYCEDACAQMLQHHIISRHADLLTFV